MSDEADPGVGLMVTVYEQRSDEGGRDHGSSGTKGSSSGSINSHDDW